MAATIELFDELWTTRGGVHFCGSLARGGELLDQVETFADVDSPEQLANRVAGVSGHFAAVLEQDNEIVIVSDRMNNVPLFYSITGSGPLVSDRFSWMQEQCPDKQVPEHTAVEHIQARALLDSRTFHPDIHKTRSREVVSIPVDGENTTAMRYDPFTGAYSKRTDETPDTLRIRLKSALDKAFGSLKQIIDDQPVLLPLTSGVDSRLVAYWLNRHGFENVYTYTYNIDVDESKTARDIAETLGFPWVGLDFTAEAFAEYVNSEECTETEQRFGGYGSKDPWPRAVLSLERIKAHDDLPDSGYVLFGYQNMIALNRLPRYLLSSNTVTKDNHIECLINWRYTNVDLNSELRSVLRDVLETSTIYEGVDDRFGAERAAELLDRYYLYEHHSSKGDGNAYLFNEYGYDLYYPLYDPNVVSFVSTVPISQRIDKKLVRTLVKRMDERHRGGASIQNNSVGLIKKSAYETFKRRVVESPLERPARMVKAHLMSDVTVQDVLDHMDSDGAFDFERVDGLTESGVFKSYHPLRQLADYEHGVDGNLAKYYGIDPLADSRWR